MEASPLLAVLLGGRLGLGGGLPVSGDKEIHGCFPEENTTDLDERLGEKHVARAMASSVARS